MIRDVGLVAGFEVMRAVRTWRAVALVAIYAVASGGATWSFTRFVGALENSLAGQLGVAGTEVPGELLSELVKSPIWRDILEAMSGSPHLVDALVTIPPLALFNLWFGFLIVPFFAASAASECVVLDVQSRAIRYEAQRTGRLEIAVGRFVGQLGLTALASAFATLVAYVVGLSFMRGHDPLGLAAALLFNLPRTWLFGVPFVALGAGASLVTGSPAWARVLAVGAASASWITYGVARWAEDHDRWALATDIALPLLPQGWLRGLWEPGPGWLVSGAACAGIGCAIVAAAFLRFAKRDL
jgi:hypothetical protein